MPRLNTRRNSSSSTWRASQANTGGRSHASQSSSAVQPVRDDALEVAENAAAGDVRERFCAAAQRARVVEVEARRRKQVVAVVVLVFEHAPHEREPVRVHAGRREADHDVAGFDRRAVDQVGRGRRRRPQVPAKSSSPSRRCRAARPSRRRRARRPASRQTSAAPSTSSATSSRSDLVGRDVVEQHQRVGAAGEHVVDAVRGEVGAAVAQAPAGAREDQLRADAVGRGCEQALVVERVQAGERAEARRAGRLDGRAQPLDDRAGGRERDSGGGVTVLRAQSEQSTTLGQRSAALAEPLAVQLGSALGAAGEERHDGVADSDRVRLQLERRGCRRARRLSPRARRRAAGARRDGTLPARRAARRSTRAAGGSRSGSPRSWRRRCGGRRAPARGRFHCVARASTAWNSSSSSATPMWSTRGTRQWPGCTTTLTAPRSSSDSRSLKPSWSSSSHETPGLDRDVIVADPAVARDEVEAELAEVAGLDVAQLGA